MTTKATKPMKANMNMNLNLGTRANLSRIRWGLSGVLAGLALVAAVQSMRTYQSHEMTTGVLAVIALAFLLVIGLASLGMARLRIGRELAALTAGQPDGELLAARRLRLEAIQASGALPAVGVLAEATRADEAGRAYIGRYLVATTVLIGLVGTFAGLMQTLGKMAPLFGDKAAGDIALLATPLAGLHVTFGASLVAILATLALALAQGDLALCEEQALAVLEDRTTHELIPRLWPTDDDMAARAVRAVEDLKGNLGETVARSLETSLKRLAEDGRVQAERSARALEAVASSLEKELGRLCEAVRSSAEEATARQSHALVEATRRQADALADTTAAVGARLADAAAAVAQGVRSEIEGAFDRAASAGLAAVEATLISAQDAVGRSVTAAEQAGQRASLAVEEMARRSGDLLAASTAQTAALLEDSWQRSARGADQLLRGATAATEETARATAAAMHEGLQRTAQLTEGLFRDATSGAARAAQATTEAITRTLQPLLGDEAARLDGVRAALGEMGGRMEVAGARLTELTAVLDDLARAQIAAIDRSGQAVLSAFDRAVLGGGAALDSAAGTLASAARDLQAGAEILAPRLGSLTTELTALGREVALLSTGRGPDGELGAAVLSELDRLAEGVDRLIQLARLAGVPVAESPPAQPAGDTDGDEERRGDMAAALHEGAAEVRSGDAGGEVSAGHDAGPERLLGDDWSEVCEHTAPRGRAADAVDLAGGVDSVASAAIADRAPGAVDRSDDEAIRAVAVAVADRPMDVNQPGDMAAAAAVAGPEDQAS